MREIKFRAYIKNLGWIVPVGRINFDVETIEVDLTDGQGDMYEYNFDEVRLMQYTGIKDDYGADIYEGDIVRCTDGEGEMHGLDSDTGIGQVKWLEKFGFWNISNIENGLGDIIFNSFLEVIGNIYENKELLEEKQ